MDSVRQFEWSDIDAFVRLLEACEEADRTGFTISAERLRHQLETPGLDAASGIWLLPGADGEVVGACSAIPLPGGDGTTVHVNVAVRPDHRNRGLEQALLIHAESGPADRHRPAADPLTFMAQVVSHQRDLIRIYEQNGYTPNRWFLQLERDLSKPIEEASTPTQIEIRQADPEVDMEAMYLAIHDSFRDHWNPPEFTLEQFRHGIVGPSFDPGLSLLAVDSQGDPAGLCLANLRDDYNNLHGTREGYVGAIGVRRPYRRRGLARALLTQALQRLKDAEMTVAVLDVDSESPTGATRLYESVGFRERRQSVVYHKLHKA